MYRAPSGVAANEKPGRFFAGVLPGVHVAVDKRPCEKEISALVKVD